MPELQPNCKFDTEQLLLRTTTENYARTEINTNYVSTKTQDSPGRARRHKTVKQTLLLGLLHANFKKFTDYIFQACKNPRRLASVFRDRLRGFFDEQQFVPYRLCGRID